MAGDVLFLGWGEVKPGREQQALDLFGEAVGYFSGLQQDGRIEGFEPFLLAVHGGDLGGFFLVRGERSELAKIRFSEEFETLVTKVSALLFNVGVIPAYTGDALAAQMGRFQQVTQEYAAA